MEWLLVRRDVSYGRAIGCLFENGRHPYNVDWTLLDMSGRKRSLRQLAWMKSGGNCCLCGLPMQLIPDVTNPLAYTVEHVVPRSRGGENELHNLEGSHSFCNNYKGDALMEELPSGVRKFLRWKIKNLIVNQRV